MYYNVRILTYGESQKQARQQALTFADELVERGEFDHHMGTRGQGGPWPETGKTYRLRSKLGQQAVEGALRATRREFDRAIYAARLMLETFTDDQIYNDDYGITDPADLWPTRYQFTQVGEGEPYLYGDHEVCGDAIRNDKDYEAATKGHEDDLWVTSINFHG